MPKRKKTCNCEHPKAKTVVHGYGKFACYLKPEPNPIRSKGTKTDAELFAEWEKNEAWLNREHGFYAFGYLYNEVKRGRTEENAAIAKELGPKLMEMRVAKTEERLRKLENKETGGNGPSGVTSGKLMLADTGNLATWKKPEPWWERPGVASVALITILFIGAAWIYCMS